MSKTFSRHFMCAGCGRPIVHAEGHAHWFFTDVHDVEHGPLHESCMKADARYKAASILWEREDLRTA
jgi:hypothetical protein